MTPSTIGRQLDRLTQVRTGNHRVVSCYLKLEPRDRARNKYLIKLKNRIRTIERSLDELDWDRKTREDVQHDLNRVLEFVKHPENLPATQGVAIFACRALRLFESVALPRVYRSRLAVDRSPLIRELASAEDEFGRLFTVVLDRTAARFFEVTAFNVTELDSMRADYTRGSKFHGLHDSVGQGQREDRYNNRIREEKQRHYAHIADHLFTLNQKAPVHGIVLAGIGATASAVEPFLHPYLAERVMGTARLNPKEASSAAVHAASLDVRQSYERLAERAVVHEMEEGLGTGWGVNGVEPTLRALARGQIRTLLVDADASMPGYRCSDSGRLALNERDCRGEGEPIPVLDVVDEAIEEGLRQRVDIDVVYDQEASAAISGLAGLLRFR